MLQLLIGRPTLDPAVAEYSVKIAVLKIFKGGSTFVSADLRTCIYCSGIGIAAV